MHKGTMRSLFVLVGLAGAAISSNAMAADISRPVYKAPPAGALPVTYDWTGFYIGGHVGYGWAQKDWQDSFGLFNVSILLVWMIERARRKKLEALAKETGADLVPSG